MPELVLLGKDVLGVTVPEVAADLVLEAEVLTLIPHFAWYSVGRRTAGI